MLEKPVKGGAYFGKIITKKINCQYFLSNIDRYDIIFVIKCFW